MCFYYYIAQAYNENNHEIYNENGYTIGIDYKNALNNLTEYYGEDNIISISLEYITDRPVLILPTEEAIKNKGLIVAIKDNNNI